MIDIPRFSTGPADLPATGARRLPPGTSPGGTLDPAPACS